MTGSHGFLGWHARAALREHGFDATRVVVGEGFDELAATAAVDGAQRVIHLAGVNRGTDIEVSESNPEFARQLASGILRAEKPPATVVYASSTQVGNGSLYGDAKAAAGEIIADAAQRVGADFVELKLPNLFGEHGRPFYNAVTATFCHLIAQGKTPEILEDKVLTLLHAQNAADLLIGNVHASQQKQLEIEQTVSGLSKRLSQFAEVYGAGEIPDITSSFDRDLFNTYRSYTFPEQTPIRLTRHADERGSFFEIIRSHGGPGQSSFSTTVPGISRGDHFHRRKIERFTVLAGRATISLRKLFSSERFDFEVTGDEPMAIDMPTMWSHRIENTGDETLFTSFWIDEIFDPANPDTIAERV